MEDIRGGSSRERSPNYPAYALPAAVEFVTRVYEAEKRSSVPPIIVGQALSGNQTDTLSGPSRSKIASMRQYGLLDEPTKGRLRVSDIALAIIQKPTPAQYQAAIAEAASNPPLFKELQQDHSDASDSAIRFHLMKDLGFTEDGANRVLKSYRETLEFANLEGSSYNGATKLGAVSLDTPISSAKLDASAAGRMAIPEKLERGVPPMAFTWPLPDGVVAQVSLLGKPTKSALNRLITFIEFMRDDISESTATAPDEQAPPIDMD